MKTSPGTKRFFIIWPLTCALGLLAPGTLRAADFYWTATGGNWLTDSWYDAPSGGNPVSAPGAADTAYIYNGVTLSALASSTHSFIDNGGIANIANGGDWQNSGTFIVGNTGIGTLNIRTGGTVTTTSTSIHLVAGNLENSVGTINVESGGYLYSGAQIRLSSTTGATGILNIASGATVRAATGVYTSLYGGNGVLNIATGGTLIIDANALYVGNGGTANASAYGVVNIDGYMESGGGGTYYSPVGYSGTGVVNIGPTGLARTGALDVGREWTASGTVRIAGRWLSTAANTTSDAYVGHAGKGTLIIEDGGYLSSRLQRYFYIGGGIAVSDTTFGSADAGIRSESVGSMVIEQGGIFRRRESYNDIVIAGGVSETVPQNRAKGTLIVDGLLDTDRYIRIGGMRGDGELYIGQTGTVNAAGLRVTYTDYSATAKVIVEGHLNLRSIISAIDEDNAYIIVAHYGDSYMHVTQTGTINATGYISVGQGDYWSRADVPNDYLTRYSGTLRMDGYLYSGNYIRIGNRLKGHLDLTSTGTMITTGYFRINENNLTVTSTANIAGYLEAGTDIQIAHNANTSGHLNIMDGGRVIAGTNFSNGRIAGAVGRVTIADSGSVAIGGNFTQNSLSTLEITLKNRPATSPVITIGGAAALSGTLKVNISGSAAANLTYTGGGEGKATDLSGLPIFRAPGGITGDFTTVDIIGVTIPPGLPDYIRGGGMRVNEGGPVDTRYDVGFGLAWKSSVADGHGDFTVEGGKTFDVNIQLADRPASMVFTSTHNWDGKSLTKKGDGTLILSVENTFTGATTVESGTLRFTGPSRHNLGTLVNSGVIDFYETNANGERIGGYRTITASSLGGDNGTFRMGVNLTTGDGDRLLIDGDAHGTHRLLITGTGAAKPKGDEAMPTLVTIGGVIDANFSAEGTIIDSGTRFPFEGNFDYGLFKYEVQMLGNKVVIVNTGLSPDVFQQIRGTGAQSLLWFDQQGNVSSRFGELRAPRELGNGFDIWARGYASNSSLGGGSSEMPKSDVDIWGADIGADYTWKLVDQRVTVGLYAGTGNASQEFKRLTNALSNSTGESDMLGVGLYGVWMMDSGWFANITASMSQYENSFDSVDGSDNHTTADYKDHGFGVSAEGGRRFALSSNGWFIEPSLQGAIVRLTRADYTTTGNHELSVNGSDATLRRLRGTLRVGRAWQMEHLGWMQIAGRIGAVTERSSGGEVVVTSAPSNRWRPNLDGERFEAGVGLYWQPFDRGQFYFDYEYSNGDNFERPWALNLGIRFSL